MHITAEVIGKGGFGTVYLADFNGFNAAAKVVVFGTDEDITSDDDYEYDNAKEEEEDEDEMQGNGTSERRRFTFCVGLLARCCCNELAITTYWCAVFAVA